MKAKKNIYFLSDAHLGSGLHKDSLAVEIKLCRWLESVMDYASAIYLMGDMFDYWYEYKYVVPKGFVRILGKLAELSDNGVEVHFFAGNHDLWLTDYLEKECGMILHLSPTVTVLSGKTFYLAHGDGLGDRSRTSRFLFHLFRSKIAKKCFSAIHPRWTFPLAHRWSDASRKSGGIPPFYGDREPLVKFANEYLQKHPEIDYFVFGHRHLALDVSVGERSRMIFLGDWITHFSYAIFDGEELKLKFL